MIQDESTLVKDSSAPLLHYDQSVHSSLTVLWINPKKRPLTTAWIVFYRIKSPPFNRTMFFNLTFNVHWPFLNCTQFLYFPPIKSPVLRWRPVFLRFYPRVQRSNKNTRKQRARNRLDHSPHTRVPVLIQIGQFRWGSSHFRPVTFIICKINRK